MNPLLDFLRSDGSIIVNKKLAHAIGLHEAILFSELISKHYYFESRGMLENGYFYNTGDNLFVDTTLTPKQQRSALKNLEKKNLVKTYIRGIPAKKHFKIQQDSQILVNIMATHRQNQQLGTFGTTSIAERSQLVEQKGHGNNTNHNTKKNNNIYTTLTSDAHSFISLYLSLYADYFKKQHPRVTEVNYDKLVDFCNELESNGVDKDMFVEAVCEYFDEVNAIGKASMIYFTLACFRYFDCNALTMSM